MTISDYAILFATLLGPFLADQARQWLKRKNEVKRRQVEVFRGRCPMSALRRSRPDFNSTAAQSDASSLSSTITTFKEFHPRSQVIGSIAAPYVLSAL